MKGRELCFLNTFILLKGQCMRNLELNFKIWNNKILSIK